MKVRSNVALIMASVALAGGAFFTVARERHSAPLPPGTNADLVVIDKSDRTLKIFKRGQELRTYSISLGSNPVGDKQREGDGRTPEGHYHIDARNERSAFHRSLHISYPSAVDRATAKRSGVSPGGDIMIHGLKNGLGGLGSFHLAWDWTQGCVAVTNEQIDELWRVVPNGTSVEIKP